MKKISILITIILLIIISLPIVGSKIMEKKLSEKIELLTSNGVEVENILSQPSYLTTTKHYKLKIKDSGKFMQYIQPQLNYKIPPYTKQLLIGTTIVIEMKYSNLALDDLSIDLYPLSVSNKLMDEISKGNRDIQKFVKVILEKKAFLYHINYNLFKSEFNGYMKDIDETFILQNGRPMKFKLSGATFNGNGMIISPKMLSSKIKELVFSISVPDEEVSIILQEFSSTSVFKYDSSYNYSASVNVLNIKMKNISIDAKRINSNIYSNTQTLKNQFSSKGSFDSCEIVNNKELYKLNNFNYEINLHDVEKDSFEKLRVILTDKSSPEISDIVSAFVDVISNGLKLNLVDLSVGKLDYKDQKDIDGFKMKADLLIKKDLSNTNTRTIKSIIFGDNMLLNTELKLSKDIFSIITKEVPLVIFAKMYAKEQGDDLVFEFEQKDGSVNINGKKVR